MVQDAKLQALRRTYEVEEQRALEEKRKIDEVLDERAAAYRAVEERYNELLRSIDELRTEGRRKARLSADGGQLASVDVFERRLKSEAEELSGRLAELGKDLERAKQRAQAAEEEVLRARLEIKKVEKFVENREQAARVTDAAIEEALQDEINFYRRKK